MSVVTGVVLCMSCCEDDGSKGHDGPPAIVEQINDWLAENGFGPLVQVEQHFGGNKHPQTHVFGAGYNYFAWAEFADFVVKRPWYQPEEVVLIMHPEEGAAMIFRPGNISLLSGEAAEDFQFQIENAEEDRALNS